jgi:hypothetical protein
MGILALLNPKENNVLFGSVHFNLGISIQFKFNRIAFNSTCNYANSFKGNLVSTKPTHIFFNSFSLVVCSNARPKYLYMDILLNDLLEGALTHNKKKMN